MSRQCAPGLGAHSKGGVYLQPGQWQFSGTYRQLNSDDHFRGNQEQHERHRLGTFVINRQRVLDLAGTYAFNRQFNMSLSVPYLVAGSWSIPLPINATGQRHQQDSSGLGDIIVTGRYWLQDAEKNAKGNYSLGVGLKVPTGDTNKTDAFPDITGANIRQRAVDQSIQPGDGGWGVLLDAQAYKTLGRTTYFTSASYLVNPRDTNDAPSIRATLGIAPDPARPSLQVNSVPDQYLFRAGALRPFSRAKGLTGSLAWRVEGVPPSDLIGKNNGFRRPGYATFIEPGLSYSRGVHTFSFNVPISLIRNRQKTRADNAPNAGDATFADYVFLFNYTRRFGK